MRITHTTKEIVSSIDISLWDIKEANSLLAELEYINRRYTINFNGISLPHFDNLLKQLKSKLMALNLSVSMEHQ